MLTVFSRGHMDRTMARLTEGYQVLHSVITRILVSVMDMNNFFRLADSTFISVSLQNIVSKASKVGLVSYTKSVFSAFVNILIVIFLRQPGVLLSTFFTVPFGKKFMAAVSTKSIKNSVLSLLFTFWTLFKALTSSTHSTQSLSKKFPSTSTVAQTKRMVLISHFFRSIITKSHVSIVAPLNLNVKEYLWQV